MNIPKVTGHCARCHRPLSEECGCKPLPCSACGSEDCTGCTAEVQALAEEIMKWCRPQREKVREDV